MKSQEKERLLLWVYGRGMALYPKRFRHDYREPILQTLRDALADRHDGRWRFWFRAFADLIESSLLERFSMLRDASLGRPLLFHTLALAFMLTVIGFVAAVTMQQMLRRGANQPQLDMASWYAGKIAAAGDAGKVIPPGRVDLASSLETFVIFYDDHGTPISGTGYLDQKLPVPPPGVFDFVRGHDSEHVTWQPRPGVRLASVVQRVGGSTPGFVLTARSLRLVEEQERLLKQMVLAVWITVMLLLFGSASMLNRLQRSQPLAR
jgi:hypothetical protein